MILLIWTEWYAGDNSRVVAKKKKKNEQNDVMLLLTSNLYHTRSQTRGQM